MADIFNVIQKARDMYNEGHLIEDIMAETGFSEAAINNIIAHEDSTDSVHHPKHYQCGDMEVIEIIKNVVSEVKDPFEAYCIGNTVKYICRWHKKNGEEDLKKGMEYIKILLDYRKFK